MEERRRGGFRVKPSFGQVLGYIQEGEPLALDLPKRNASIYTSSHFYLDDYPNAPEPVSETPLPHTSINPAAAFETAEATMESPSRAPPESSRGRPSCPTATTGAAIPARLCATTGWTRPGPRLWEAGSAKAASKPRRR